MKALREKKHGSNAASKSPFLQRTGKHRADGVQGSPFISRKPADSAQSQDREGDFTRISGKIVQRSLLDDTLNIVSPGLGKVPGLAEGIIDAGKWVGKQSIQNLEFVLDHAADFSKDVLWNYASLYMRRLHFYEAILAYLVFGDRFITVRC